ncbi:hypothetical protein [Ralstonia mannitolilytica]|nr:hypothetical protein [Ralstonia mannitolilytica]
MHNGVPFDVAFSLDDTMRQAMAIKCSEFHGAEFDLVAMQFKERER